MAHTSGTGWSSSRGSSINLKAILTTWICHTLTFQQPGPAGTRRQICSSRRSSLRSSFRGSWWGICGSRRSSSAQASSGKPVVLLGGSLHDARAWQLGLFDCNHARGSSSAGARLSTNKPHCVSLQLLLCRRRAPLL